MTLSEPVLLSDDEVSRFITDGFLLLSPDVPPNVHKKIDERLLSLPLKEGNPGNNVLPMVPEMYTVLNSSVIRGALTSILGPGYVLHPHRYVHNNEPGKVLQDGLQKVGEGSHSFVGWHQDDHSPLSRPRHHYPRYAMILYYPQDTPVEMGPTQVIPATHLSKSQSDSDRIRGIQAFGPAGTCVLLHFDLVHGGSLNLSDRTRNMVKFVFARCSDPTEPSWNCRTEAWKTPVGHLSPVENAVVWRHHWEWMCGRNPTARSDAPVAAHIDLLRSCTDDPVRQATIYSLAQAGASAVLPLGSELASAGAQRSGWNEGAVVMEDAAYAFAAIGAPAIPALIELLGSPSEWVRINAAFALGEIGPRAASAMPKLVSLLNDESHPVVRTVLDAIGQIRSGSNTALPEIRRLMEMQHPPESWIAPQRRKWTGLGQVQTNATMCLLRMGSEADGAEEWLPKVLDNECGYVGGFGVEYLLRWGLRKPRQQP